VLTKIQYTDSLDRQAVIDANIEKTLIEEQNISDGNFLIFTDTPRMEDEVQQLKKDNLILMDALATMYEDMLAKGTV
jgi:hypothetical protein